MTNKILNLTQHQATKDQTEAGVYEPADKEFVQAQLNFEKLPTSEEVRQKANNLAHYAKAERATHVMIGGASFLMSALEQELKVMDIVPVYAFSQRVSVETVNGDGTVTKQNVFKHLGFIEV